MKRSLCGVVLAMALASPVKADESLDALKQQMQQMQQQMLQMQEKIKQLETEKTEKPATNAATTVAVPAPTSTPALEKQPWSPVQPLTIAGGGTAYLNLSFDVLMDVGTSSDPNVTDLELGGHDPNQRGFTLPNAEIALDGAVDPYFKGFANIVFQLDEQNETSVELEEAFLLTSCLPWNLQAKAGQFFAAFGRQNATHPHTWAFVDSPLVLARLLGPDGLRNVGAQLSWLAPTPFYTELMLGVFNGEGETAYSFRDPNNTYGRTPVNNGVSSMGDLLYVPRVTSSFDLNDTQTLVLGATAAFGANDSGASTSTQIYGVDAYWKWRPVSAQQGFPFVSWQTEALWRNYEAGADPSASLTAQTIHDWGVFSQVLYGFDLGWVAGLRSEYSTGEDGGDNTLSPRVRGDRFRLSPDITWYVTEFSKLRLQFNYDHGNVVGDQYSVWMQIEFMLGAHGAHKF